MQGTLTVRQISALTSAPEAGSTKHVLHGWTHTSALDAACRETLTVRQTSAHTSALEARNTNLIPHGRTHTYTESQIDREDKLPQERQETTMVQWEQNNTKRNV